MTQLYFTYYSRIQCKTLFEELWGNPSLKQSISVSKYLVDFIFLNKWLQCHTLHSNYNTRALLTRRVAMSKQLMMSCFFGRMNKIRCIFDPCSQLVLADCSHNTRCHWFLRFGDVCHHGHHPGALLCHWQLCAPEEALAPWVHSDLYSVFCEILHHWCHSAGGGCSWRPATGCYYLLGLFCQGRTCIYLQISPSALLYGMHGLCVYYRVSNVYNWSFYVALFCICSLNFNWFAIACL